MPRTEFRKLSRIVNAGASPVEIVVEQISDELSNRRRADGAVEVLQWSAGWLQGIRDQQVRRIGGPIVRDVLLLPTGQHRLRHVLHIFKYLVAIRYVSAGCSAISHREEPAPR